MNSFFLACFVIVAISLLLVLLRAVLGPRFTDRIMCANLASTKTIAMAILLSLYLNEKYLLDIAFIYAILGYVAIIVLGKIFAGRHHGTPNDTKKKVEEK